MVKKKILFVAPNLNPGGAESVLIKIMNNFDENEYEFKLVLLKKTGSLLHSLKKHIEIIDLGVTKTLYSPLKLYKVIKKENPDIVFSIIGQVNLLLACLKKVFFKKILFVGRENAVYSEWLYKNPDLKKKVLQVSYKLWLKNLDIVIVQSEYMREQVKKYFKVPKEKIRVLQNPIEHQKIDDLKIEPITNKNWNPQKINLIAVGRLEKVKNYYDMIDIVSTLPDEFHLNIFGDGNEKELIKKYIKKKRLSKKVTLHGFVTNPYKFMNDSFALLLTSYRESFPNVVLEANACGTFTFSYNMPGGISEIIKADQTNGIIVKYGDKETMSNLIKDRYRIGTENSKIIESTKDYAIEKYLLQIYNIIENKN